MKKRILFIVPLLGLLMSCDLQEPIDPVFYDYLGLWESDRWMIEIFQNGSANFDSNRVWEEDIVQGRIHINGRRLKIVGEEGRCILHIDEAPTDVYDAQDNFLYTYMVLEGKELIRTR